MADLAVDAGQPVCAPGTLTVRNLIILFIVFAGGCAKNTYLQGLFETRFRTKIHVHENPDMLAALGAARYAEREGYGAGARPGFQNQREGKEQKAVAG